MLKVFNTDNQDTFKLKALHWANTFTSACYFDSNHYSDPYSAFDVLIGAGAKKEISNYGQDSFSKLKEFLKSEAGYIPGFFSYDLKNEIENLRSKNPDHLKFPDIHFFLPEHLLIISGNIIKIYSDNPDSVWQSVNNFNIHNSGSTHLKPVIKSRFTREEYIHTVEEIQKHIQRGDIYEINFCQEFYAENVQIDPLELFIRLNNLSPTPFANFFRLNDLYIISATPERFLSRKKNKLISQPIKGTTSRNANRKIDEIQKEQLLNDEKERAENVMIVDLVRNDLTKSAKQGSVRVEELFGIYSFKQVHQLISTIVCEAREDLSNADIIANTFPMGSMTGAPKIRAMQLADQYERSKRGIYSGAVGYFSPDGDFDFNVVIRTILYNSSLNYLSFHTGSAITLDSDPVKEYEECVLKGKAITKVLSQS
ncbi:anthranilate synthase component I family protein [Daejeonella sp. H1SJ63]|jgi:para-aminobenzoate synthetase component 1|uniref:anthranilate synthase component I family protein n=1 Tax=Daejeonella sp. H1SJ63 TaxID=3034145 RepID=UPI0023EDD037|nr:anthranilate synthase component I family protein [Daejeonella sp. H1SJ63]